MTVVPQEWHLQYTCLVEQYMITAAEVLLGKHQACTYCLIGHGIRGVVLGCKVVQIRVILRCLIRGCLVISPYWKWGGSSLSSRSMYDQVSGQLNFSPRQPRLQGGQFGLQPAQGALASPSSQRDEELDLRTLVFSDWNLGSLLQRK